MNRTLSINNIFKKKHDMFTMEGIWQEVFGDPENNGIWMIWGPEKNGKTWFALRLADCLSNFGKVHYISAEEGISKGFKEAILRAKLSSLNKRIKFSEYESLGELYDRLGRQRSPKIVIIDNITVYNDELKNGALRKLQIDFPEVLFVFLAHEDRGEPYTATAKLCRRLANIIIKVEGLACQVSGRCPGGRLLIDEERAALYHGEPQIKALQR